ncbi:hypothetical protein MASR2M69_08130 [Bacteroidota bacterium]
MQSKKWSIAATYGFVLALITISYQLIQTVFEPGTAIALILWAAKFGGTLYLLYYFIKEFSKQSDLFTYSDGFKFGVIVSFMLFNYLCSLYISPLCRYIPGFNSCTNGAGNEHDAIQP